MHYSSLSSFAHDRTPATGVLLVNLGTPNAPTPAAVRRYLAEFLSDPRVVELPRLLWKSILHGVILRIRPRPVSQAYASIWMPEGSPLLVHSRALTEAVSERFRQHDSGPIHFELAMRYGQPSIEAALNRLRQQNVERLVVIPLYPQYSGTTTATVFDAVSKTLQKWRWLPDFRMPMHYHDHPLYIQAVADSIQKSFHQHGRPERLLMSFHGLPQRLLRAGDPYYCHCQKTGRLIAEQLGLESDEYAITFQSRFGREPWLQPYTDVTLKEWGALGIKHVQIVSPGFAADCLETLEELAIQNNEFFTEAGGEQFHYIPALNASDAHVELMSALIQQEMAGWHPLSTDNAHTAQRAISLGAEK
jgi:ferrochelatase